MGANIKTTQLLKTTCFKKGLKIGRFVQQLQLKLMDTSCLWQNHQNQKLPQLLAHPSFALSAKAGWHGRGQSAK